MLAELAIGDYLRDELKRLAREFEADALRVEIDAMIGAGRPMAAGTEP